jgi:uncharacterized protein
MKHTKLHLAVALSLPLLAHAAQALDTDADLLARGNAGDVTAQRMIGEQLLHGDGTAPNTAEGVRWLLMAAQKGDTASDVLLGDYYLTRREDNANYTMAVHHLQRAAASGNLQGADTLVQTLIEHALRSTTPREDGDKEIASALPFLKPSAARRNQTSCFYAGYLSFLGRGVPHNLLEAEKNMRCAADQGHAMAAFWVAGALLADVPTPMKAGTPKVEEARVYLKTAAERGHNGAAQLLASLPTAADVTHPVAMKASVAPRLITSEMPPAVVAAPQIAVASPSIEAPRIEPAPKEKPAPLPVAAVACEAPTSEVIQPEAIARLQAQLDVANQKITQLQSQLASVRTHQEDVLEGEALNRQALAAIAKGDYATAIPKLRSAIKLGDVPAEANLGLMILQGNGVTANITEAVDLLARAANEGNRTAAENLARLYESGSHMPRDITRAVDWYRKAQTLGSVRALPALKRLGAAS